MKEKKEKEAKEKTTCSVFGTGYDPNVAECQICKKEYADEYKKCKELTLKASSKGAKTVAEPGKVEKVEKVEKVVAKPEKVEKGAKTVTKSEKVEKVERSVEKTKKEWVTVSKTKKDWEKIILEKYPKRGAGYVKIIKHLSKTGMGTSELVKKFGRAFGWGERIWIAKNAVKLYKKNGKWVAEI